MAAYHRVYGLVTFGRLPVHQDQLQAELGNEYERLRVLNFTFTYCFYSYLLSYTI